MKVQIRADVLRSEISVPAGDVLPAEVTEIVIEGKTHLFRRRIHLLLRTQKAIVDFYRSRSLFDIVLMLDDLAATIGERPRTVINVRQNLALEDNGSGRQR